MSEEKIEFQFTSAQIMSKVVYPLSETKVVPSKFNYEVTVETRVEPNQGVIIVNVMVTIRDSDNFENVCAHFSVWCVYHVIDFNTAIKKNDIDMFVIPEILEKTIRPVSISTVRGIIYADLRNTYLQNTIMPVIFMDTFKPITTETKEVEKPSINVEKVISPKRKVKSK